MEKVPPGTLIYLYHNEQAKYLTAYQPGKKVSSHLGEIILPPDLHYGAQLLSSKGASFHVLIPTTADLAMKVRRTTTIIYPKDAGLMLLETGIGAGSRVLEVGTGSGAMTIILARAVGKEGHVYSFERRPEFQENARENLRRAGLEDRVTFLLRDPALEGFGLPSPVDAAIIDVPEPWTLVAPLREALRGGAAAAFLIPTIDQVLRTWEALQKSGFLRLRCVEVWEREMLIRPGKTRPRERMVSHTGYLLFAHKGAPQEGGAEP